MEDAIDLNDYGYHLPSGNIIVVLQPKKKVTMTKIAKAMNIVARFEGRLPSRKIREKIASQCSMSPNGAATYYYTCRAQISKPSKKKKAA